MKFLTSTHKRLRVTQCETPLTCCFTPGESGATPLPSQQALGPICAGSQLTDDRGSQRSSHPGCSGPAQHTFHHSFSLPWMPAPCPRLRWARVGFASHCQRTWIWPRTTSVKRASRLAVCPQSQWEAHLPTQKSLIPNLLIALLSPWDVLAASVPLILRARSERMCSGENFICLGIPCDWPPLAHKK